METQGWSDDSKSVSLEKIYRKYRSCLVRYASRMMSNRLYAEDIVQDVFAKLVLYDYCFVSEMAALGFIYKAVNNRSIDMMRGIRKMEEISAALQKGNRKAVISLVQQAIDEGAFARDILEKGLLKGMSIIGEKFKNNEVYVPEVLIAARAMNAGTELLKPLLVSEGVKATGKVVIGTVKGDQHDIGKNLVRMMMEGKGLEVIDLGVNVSAEAFIHAAMENNAQIIACSALLTTTMDEMRRVVETAKEKGIRNQVKIMIGGAPVTDSYCKSIGADAYTPDAATAADVAAGYCQA